MAKGKILNLNTEQLLASLPRPESVPGFSSFIPLYEEMVKGAPPECTIVEVGSWCGRSSIAMARAIIRSGKQIQFVCIDKWDFRDPKRVQGTIFEQHDFCLFDIWTEAISPFRPYVNVRALQCDSSAAAALFDSESVWFVYIDADHLFKSVFKDIKAWYPKVRFDGHIGGHDLADDIPGVEKAVRKFFGEKWKKWGQRSWLHTKAESVCKK